MAWKIHSAAAAPPSFALFPVTIDILRQNCLLCVHCTLSIMSQLGVCHWFICLTMVSWVSYRPHIYLVSNGLVDFHPILTGGGPFCGKWHRQAIFWHFPNICRSVSHVSIFALLGLTDTALARWHFLIGLTSVRLGQKDLGRKTNKQMRWAML